MDQNQTEVLSQRKIERDDSSFDDKLGRSLLHNFSKFDKS